MTAVYTIPQLQSSTEVLSNSDVMDSDVMFEIFCNLKQ